MTAIPLPVPTVGPPLPGRGCDCTACAFWSGPDGRGGPATIEPLCSGSNSSCSYCGCAAAEAAAPAGARRTCPVRCPSRQNIAAWMADLGGSLAFDDVALPAGLPALPAFIPQVDGSAVTDLDASLSWPAYAVGLRRVISPETITVYPRFTDNTAHQALALRPAAKAVLVGYGEDPLVEAIWTQRHRNALIEQIAAGGWDVVLACNYSIYGNWPRLEHLVNMRRSVLLARELADASVTAVPNLYWFRLEDLRRWIDWTLDDATPAIAINAQTVRENANWDSWMRPGLHYLAENLPEDLPVFLTGLSRTDRIAEAAALFGTRLHLISQNPHQYALHGAIMTADGRQDVHARPADAFAATVRYMAGLLPTRSRP